MKNKNQRYSREDKIEFYTRRVLNLKFALKQAEARLEYIKSDQYQDWDSDLERSLSAKRKAKGA